MSETSPSVVALSAPVVTTAARKRLSIPFSSVLLPLAGLGLVVVIWAFSSATWSTNLPSPGKTWQVSKPFITAPFEKRGELDQGIARFAWYSLWLVAKGYALAILIGTPIGFLLGRSKLFAKSFDPLIQI